MEILIDSTLLLDKYTIDASSSWNGYNHQGKIGILVVIKMINELNLNFNTCNEYELELEWLEDFSIKKSNKYLSIHQVKTYNKSAPSEYKDAIWLLLAKLSDFPEIESAYLHSTTQISKVDDLDKFKKVLQDYIPPKEKKSESNKDLKQEEVTNKKYWTPRKCHDYIKDNGLYDTAFNKFEIYAYEENSYHCSMDEVENKIKDQLKIFNNGKATAKQLDYTYMHLLGLVDKNIRNRHIDIQSKKTEQKANITFQEIFKTIESNFEHPSKEYAIFYLRNRFNTLSRDYLEDLDCEVELGELDSLETVNVRKLINSVGELSDEEFLRFCMKITPHHEVNNENPEAILTAISEFIINTSMNDGFFEILKRIQKEISLAKYTFIKRGSSQENISYLPTTITEMYHTRRTGRLVEKILNNSNDESLLEVDVMITKEINLPELKPEKFSKDIPETENEDDKTNNESIDVMESKREYHDRISKIKKIKMIDIKKAKGELDE